MLRRTVRKIVPKSFRQRAKSLMKTAVPIDWNARRSPKRQPYQLRHDYTIVSAAYNAAPYLDDYFSSIFEQTCTTSRISIIIVDDGSSDATADIIALWQKKYPSQITYLRQSNGGPGAARNHGLQHVSTEWVTFMDSDDKLAPNYFEEVDKSITNHPALILATCHVVLWWMAENRLQPENLMMRHFLNKSDNSYYAVGDEQIPPIFFMNATFFKTDLIRRSNLTIDEGLRPNFEDGKFIACYLFDADSGTVGLLNKAHYLYRKRSDQSSVIDKSRHDSRKYLLVPQRGYLDILEKAAAKYGHAPLNVQKTVLEEISWHIKEFENQPARWTSIGPEEDQQRYFAILDQIFRYISPEALFGMDSEFLAYRRKIGLADTFLHENPPYMLCKLRKVNTGKRYFLIETYSPDVQFYFDGLVAQPFETKRASATLCGKVLYHRFEHWIEYPEDAQIFSFRLPDGREVRLDVHEKKTYKRSVGMKSLLKQYADGPNISDTWIFLDRGKSADDNAEHLYRYLKTNHPEQNAVFALSRKSSDWKRLEEDGFNLIDFDSPAFKREANHASKVICSHAGECFDLFDGDGFSGARDFIYLQNGVAVNDLSLWLNSFTPSLILTSTSDETDHFIKEGSPYILTAKQVAMTGLPRYDHLLEVRKRRMESKGKSAILLLPTWRRYLTDAEVNSADTVDSDSGSKTSAFVAGWQQLLDNARLYEIARKYDLDIVFYPHPQAIQLLKRGQLRLPNHIKLGLPDKQSFQEYAAQASLCVTDYSSSSIDISLLGIPVVYYQFDTEEFYEDECGQKTGFFEFERDGFGPVVDNENECLEAIETIASQGFEMAPEYAERAAKIFSMADGHCCERAYEAIESL